ncbi:MAG: HNH endonuclease [Bacteroidales bacterium]|jgi:5-methylcytosine-specific restriction endonuclease McrA|nr:HNH endonuclease [Bacteroidales bacterium]
MNKNQEERVRIHKKFNGHCSYCGRVITMKEMQVDHQFPKAQLKYFCKKIDNVFVYPDLDCFDNLFPSCRRCNHYKRDYTLEQFRNLMQTLHTRIGQDYINKVAMDFGIIQITPFSGRFYFEQFNNR